MSDIFAVFLHADVRITDISPLPQLFAALFMAAAGVLLVYVIRDKKITKTACLMSLPLGLSPYFLECFSYKFDSPYMALSVFISIVPFLFLENYLVFSLCSFIAVLIMCMTYQASSGIYIIIVVLLCFKAWNERLKSNKEILCFSAVSMASYCVSMIYYRLFLMQHYDGYVSTGIYPLSQIFSGVFHNFIRYIRLVNNDFGVIWKFLLVLICILFLVKTVITTRRNRIASLIISFVMLVVMCAMSFAVYLFLMKPLFDPRAMYGFGVFIAVISVYLSDYRKKIIIAPSALLCWCFFVFSFSYGNALSDQKRYNNFRTEILLHDLSMLFPDRAEEPIPIKLKNTEGYAPSIKNIAVRNPVIYRLVPVNLGQSWGWANIYLTRYYNFNFQQDESIEEVGLNELFDSYYHTIKSDGRKVFVVLK